jgi:hypothetical protein
MVGSKESVEIAVKIRITRDGGSSNVFKNAFEAFLVADSNWLRIAILKRASVAVSIRFC